MIDRIIDTKSIVNLTNVTTVSGSSIFGIGVKLAIIPYPPLQVFGGILCLVGAVTAFYKEGG